MNILIPDQWLREHLTTNATVADISKFLSLSGPSVERVYEGDVYDIEVTTNRVDSMSVRGIAREAATILKRAKFQANLQKLTKHPIIKHPEMNLALPEIIYQTEAVKRVICTVVADVKQTASPAAMSERLAQVGISSHGALIDISNYITHELGHPCHIFDYDAIMKFGGKIIIKEATKGKKFVTLDEVEHQTLGGEIVFESADGEIIDLPAIKGTLNTGVTDNTRNVLFWIESLDAKKVRQASMGHAIRTVAASLNEKNVDPHLATEVMEEGVYLLQKLCHGKVASEVYDYFPLKRHMNRITLPWQRINDYLGLTLEHTDIVSILENLDCQVKTTPTHLEVIPPTCRFDLQIPADIIEEIARIYGYHNLPSKLMDGELSINPDPQTDYQLEERVKHFLATLGWQEIYSYSLISEKQAQDSGYKIKDHLKLANPLKEENSYLRRSLIPSLLDIFVQNPQAGKLSIFELAHVYQPQQNELPAQILQLSLVSNQEYRKIKTDLVALLQKLYALQDGASLVVKEMSSSELQMPQAKQGAKLIIQSQKHKHTIGQLSVIADKVAIEIDWRELLKVSRKHPSYQALVKTAIIKEDLTFTLTEQTRVGDLINAMQAQDQRVKNIELKDQYQQNFTFTLSFQDPQNNLSGEEMVSLRQNIVQVAKEQFNAQLVGQI